MSDSETKVETKDERRGSKLMPETDIPPFKDNFMGAQGIHPEAYFSRYFSVKKTWKSMHRDVFLERP